jgi:dolichol-phosphate mannosyltransferase
MSVIVVVPTYNEADNITELLTSLTTSPVRPHVLVVDDSSPDGTGDRVQAFAADTGQPVHLLLRSAKQGLGAAYRAGFRHALRHGYDVVVQMDADGSHPVASLPDMLAAVKSGADLVIGSRYAPGGGTSADWPLSRRLISSAGNGYARFMLRLPIRDLTGGYKVWRASLLAEIDLGAADAAGYAFQIQTTHAAIRAGADVAEIPIQFTDRRYGQSKMSRRIVLEAAAAVARLRWSADHSPRLSPSGAGMAGSTA